jgi:hypothetical protein
LESPLQQHGPIVIGIEPLAMEYVERLFAAAPVNLIPSLRERFRESGSLKPFDESRRYRANLQKNIEIFDASEVSFDRRIELEFRALDRVAQGMVVAVAAHAGPVDRQVLSTFLSERAVRDRFEIIGDLGAVLASLEHRLLLIGTDRDMSAHERLQKVIASDPFLSTMTIAFQQLWRDLYQDTSLFIPDNERYRQLLFYCAKLDDGVGLAEALEQIGRRGIATRNPRSIIGFLRELTNRIDFGPQARGPNQLQKIVLEQGKFFYQAGWLDEAISCLTLVSHRSSRYEYLLAELYCATLHQERGSGAPEPARRS